MNEQEAIEIIKNEHCVRCDKKFPCYGCYIGKSIAALKKQIDMKPLENIVCFYCPKCKRFVESVYNYCWFCGQKLDWTVEE